MGSGGSFKSYSGSYKRTKKLVSDDDVERDRAVSKRKDRIASSRATMGEKKESTTRETKGLYNSELVRSKITKPKERTERIHIVLIDNSGSNRVIAEYLKKSSGYFLGVLNNIDPESQIAFNYFSDHTDGDRLMQEIDFISPDEEGDKILYSTLQHTLPANGYDEAEAIECVLWDICGKHFGDVKEKHLYLVTDVVAHGMGLISDSGCPLQRDWKKSVEEVYETFDSFVVVGCGDDPRVGDLQKQFIKPERLAFDLIDLSAIPEQAHRTGISGNAILFLIARHTGFQGVEMFLSFLYEKWLKDPVFGANTDMRAKEAIRRFGKYIEAPEEEIEKMMKKILV